MLIAAEVPAELGGKRIEFVDRGRGIRFFMVAQSYEDATFVLHRGGRDIVVSTFYGYEGADGKYYGIVGVGRYYPPYEVYRIANAAEATAIATDIVEGLRSYTAYFGPQLEVVHIRFADNIVQKFPIDPSICC